MPKHNGEADSPVVLRLRDASPLLRALWSEPALRGFDVSQIAGVDKLKDAAARDWALRALEGELMTPGPQHGFCTPLERYDYHSQFKVNYPMDCQGCEDGGKKKRASRTKGGGRAGAPRVGEDPAKKTSQTKLAQFFSTP